MEKADFLDLDLYEPNVLTRKSLKSSQSGVNLGDYFETRKKYTDRKLKVVSR